MRTQYFAQRGYVVGNAAFFDEGVGPNPLHEVLFVHHPAGFFYQQEEGLKNFRCEWNIFARAVEGAVGNVKPEGAEFEEIGGGPRGLWLVCHVSKNQRLGISPQAGSKPQTRGTN